MSDRTVAWKPEAKQELALTCPAREVLYGGSKGSGKDLAIETPVPTPFGWTTMGELKVGDEVIGVDGEPTRVVGVSERMFNECYELRFSDGSTIVAGEGHLWHTMTAAERRQAEHRTPEWRAARRAARPSRGTGKRPDLAARNASRAIQLLEAPSGAVRTTGEIASELYAGHTVNHSISQHVPLAGTSRALSIDPYVLGVWLGDGTSANGRITGIDREIFEEIRQRGYEVKDHSDARSVNVGGLKTQLRALGLLNNKHIPNVYLRASFSQRIDLIRGLMDTDGTVTDCGSCALTLKSAKLFDGVIELLRTLGIVVTPRRVQKRCTNSPTRAVGWYWHMQFATALSVFLLPRKRNKQHMDVHTRYRRRFITAATPIGRRETVCIQVEAANGMFLAGKQFIPTHNSEWLAACWAPLLALAHKKWKATGQRQHRCRIVVFRKNLEHLKDLIAKTQYIYPAIDPAMGPKGYHTNDKVWTFSSGATVAFRHLDGPNDHLGWHGQELVGLGIDQVEQIPRDVYVFLAANVRSGDREYHEARMIRCTANPGGHDWILEHFGMNEYPEGGKVLTKREKIDGVEYETTRAFIKAKMEDNSHLTPDYKAQLRSIYNDDEIDMYINANFFRVAGSYFSKLIRPSLHYRKSHSVPGSWQFRFAMDWGSTNPAAWLLGALDADGRLWVVDEVVQPGVTGRRFGDVLRKKYATQAWSADKRFATDEFWGVIDRQAMDRYGSDASAADGILESGFRLFPAQKDRLAGCNAMKERLMLDAQEQPRLVVFEDRCPNLCRALGAIKSQAPRNPDDYEELSPHSHVIDAFRYLCMEMPVQERRETDTVKNEWDRYLARAHAMQAAREKGWEDREELVS